MTEMSKEVTDGVARAATSVAARYVGYITRDDIYQHLYVYAVESNHHFETWIGKKENHRVTRALYGAARWHCEAVKAEAAGYSLDDVVWYSPAKVNYLLPLALDPQFSDTSSGADSVAFEGGGLLVMVLDVREALRQRPAAWFTVDSYDEESTEYQTALQDLCDALGGEHPGARLVERRQLLSNREAFKTVETV